MAIENTIALRLETIATGFVAGVRSAAGATENLIDKSVALGGTLGKAHNATVSFAAGLNQISRHSHAVVDDAHDMATGIRGAATATDSLTGKSATLTEALTHVSAGTHGLGDGIRAAAETTADLIGKGDHLNGILGRLQGLTNLAGVGFSLIAEHGKEAIHAVRELSEVFLHVVEMAAEFAEELEKVSERSGISVESLSQLRFAAEQSKTSFENLATGLKFLQRNIGKVASGSSTIGETLIEGGTEAQKAFRALGVSVTDATGKIRATEDVLNDVADGLQRTTNESQRTQFALAIFGRGAIGLVPLLSKGSEGLAEFRREASELGLVVSSKFALQSSEYIQNQKKIQGEQNALRISLAEGVLPALTRLQETFISIGKNDTLRKFLRIVGQSVGFLVDVLDAAIIALGAFISVIGRLATRDIVGAVNDVVNGARAIGGAFTDAGSATHDAADEIAEASEIIETAAERIERIREMLGTFATQVVTNFESLFSELSGQPERAAEKIVELAQAFGELGNKGVDALTAIITQVAAANREGGGLTGTLSNALREIERIRERAAAAKDELEIGAAELARFAPRAKIREAEVQGPAPPGEFKERVLPEPAEPVKLDTGLEELIAVRDIFGEIRLVSEQAFSAMRSGASSVADTLVAAASGAKDAFSQFFKGLLRQLAVAIIRAVILKALLSFGGGIGSLVSSVGRFLNPALGVAGPGGAQLPGDEGLLGRLAGSRSLAGSLRGGAPLAAGAGGGGAAFTVQIHEATPRTWAEITDTRISPRLRQRRDELNEDPL